ncbi:thioredoxin domain-containing protein [Candidatus Saccharibacteria bacterium TM7i]|nr:thioredoxin domain-containing protein [Candidatus Saccharibacteria bacterium TM7i]
METIIGGILMTKIGWIIFITAVVVGLGSLIAWARISNPPLDVSGIDANVAISASEKNGNIADHVTGKVDSKVVLIEYGDYQCPGCGSAAPYVQQLMEEYNDKIAFIFRNFPLTSIHPNAKAAAATAEAAGLQGKYWEMNHHLYQAQSEWSSASVKDRTNTFNGYASSLGLDLKKFEQDIASAEVAKKINFDQAIGKRESVSATPTFVLNGKKVSEETADGITKGNLDAIKKEIDALLK